MSGVLSVRSVPFLGERSPGNQPLTWGQQWIWRAVSTQAPEYAHLGWPFRVDVPSGCDLESVLSALSAILRRHETLRTRFFVDEQGIPGQIVVEQGELQVEVRDGGSEDVAGSVQQAQEELGRLPFTIPEISVRAAVILSEGVPRHVVLVVFHMAIDAWGMHRITGELVQFLRARAEATDLPALEEISHPTDRAQQEASPAGRRRSQAVMKRWRRAIDTFPRIALPDSGSAPETPRFKEHTLYSKALFVAAPALARELRTDVGSVILAHSLRLLGKLSGNPRCGFLVFSHNRFQDEDLRYSGTLVQSVPVGVDVEAAGLGELVRACHQSVLRAVMGGAGDPNEFAALLEDFAAETGHAADVSCAFNLLFPEFGTAAEQHGNSSWATESTARALLAESRFGSVKGCRWDDMKFYLGAYAERGELIVMLRADTALLPSAEIARFLANLESSVVDSLADQSCQ
ncbi:condensation domain-containing protein [Streptomyces sp. NPDC127079]|uniref:condensation domain-containing protein n=1 Tax=Streptomyces sp. NPDC127079 TaxID=3347132 RepID=UPI00365867EA